MRNLRHFRSLGALVALSAGMVPAAHADFVVQSAPAPSPAAAPPVAMAPIVDPGDKISEAVPASKNGHPAGHWKAVYGFGNSVPLAFACRQIVPPADKVIYGPGANPNDLVSWKGGHGWNRVLYAAVAPLGLRIVMNRTTVEIRK